MRRITTLKLVLRYSFSRLTSTSSFVFCLLIIFLHVLGPQETIQIVSHQQARQLFLNKSVVVLGSSGKRLSFLYFAP